MKNPQQTSYSMVKDGNTPPKMRSETSLLSPPPFSVVLEVVLMGSLARKEVKSIQGGKKEVKLSLFTDMILHIAYP